MSLVNEETHGMHVWLPHAFVNAQSFVSAEVREKENTGRDKERLT